MNRYQTTGIRQQTCIHNELALFCRRQKAFIKTETGIGNEETLGRRDDPEKRKEETL